MSYAVEYNGSRLSREGEHATIEAAKAAAQPLTQRGDVRDLVIRSEGGNTSFRSGRAVSMWVEGDWSDADPKAIQRWWESLSPAERAVAPRSTAEGMPDDLASRLIALGGNVMGLAPSHLYPEDAQWIAEQAEDGH